MRLIPASILPLPFVLRGILLGSHARFGPKSLILLSYVLD